MHHAKVTSLVPVRSVAAPSIVTELTKDGSVQVFGAPFYPFRVHCPCDVALLASHHGGEYHKSRPCATEARSSIQVFGGARSSTRRVDGEAPPLRSFGRDSGQRTKSLKERYGSLPRATGSFKGAATNNYRRGLLSVTVNLVSVY